MILGGLCLRELNFLKVKNIFNKLTDELLRSGLAFFLFFADSFLRIYLQIKHFSR